MIICTYIFAETNGTREMRRSVERYGHELAVVTAGPSPDHVNQQMIALYKRASGGHKKFLYADAADSFFQRSLSDDDIPDDHILYSTEKACYPYPEYNVKHPASTSPWKFLNGGGVCGSLELMIEYFQKYRLHDVGSKNGQAYLQERLFDAGADGFPVRLDFDCNVFQTLAFADDSEFSWVDGLLYNKVTGTTPIVLHGNGLTDMSHIYKRFADEERA